MYWGMEMVIEQNFVDDYHFSIEPNHCFSMPVCLYLCVKCFSLLGYIS